MAFYTSHNAAPARTALSLVHARTPISLTIQPTAAETASLGPWGRGTNEPNQREKEVGEILTVALEGHEKATGTGPNPK